MKLFAGLRCIWSRTSRGPAGLLKRYSSAAEPVSTAEEHGGRLLLGFTCKRCSTRTHHHMSRQAYDKGVVLVECPTCRSRHLIADNLGWFKDLTAQHKGLNVEQMAEVNGECVRREAAEGDYLKGSAEEIKQLVK